MEVDEILETSIRNNERTGINGLLIYNGRNFLQLLEGDKASLASVMRRISQDRRHTGIVMLKKGEVERQACAGWAMKRIAIDMPVEQRVRTLAEILPEGLAGSIQSTVLNFAVLN